MQRQHDRNVLLAHEFFQNGQQFELVADVEERGRLVEYKHARLLTDGTGEQDALALTVADAGKIAVREVLCVHEGERLADFLFILRAEQAEPPGIGVAPRRRHIPAGHALGRQPPGHHDGKGACGFVRGQAAAVAAV